MSPTELTKVRDVLARALSVEAVNQLGRDTGQAVRLRTVTPHRLFLAVVSALGQWPRGVARGLAARLQLSQRRPRGVQSLLQSARPGRVHRCSCAGCVPG